MSALASFFKVSLLLMFIAIIVSFVFPGNVKNAPSLGFPDKEVPAPVVAPLTCPNNGVLNAAGLPAGMNNNYCFYQGLDSNGGDIKNVPGGFAVAATACDSDPTCLGLNSNGWIKKTLVAPASWVKWTEESGKGLWVKLTS